MLLGRLDSTSQGSPGEPGQPWAGERRVVGAPHEAVFVAEAHPLRLGTFQAKRTPPRAGYYAVTFPRRAAAAVSPALNPAARASPPFAPLTRQELCAGIPRAAHIHRRAPSANPPTPLDRRTKPMTPNTKLRNKPIQQVSLHRITPATRSQLAKLRNRPKLTQTGQSGKTDERTPHHSCLAPIASCLLHGLPNKPIVAALLCAARPEFRLSAFRLFGFSSCLLPHASCLVPKYETNPFNSVALRAPPALSRSGLRLGRPNPRVSVSRPSLGFGFRRFGFRPG